MADYGDVLTAVEDLVAELNLGNGESDEARGLRLCTRAIDLLELEIAGLPSNQRFSLGTTQEITTTADQNYVDLPADLLIWDGIHLLQESGGDILWRLCKYPYVGDILEDGDPIYDYFEAIINTKGKPREYFIFGNRIYLSPTPNAVYSLQWWGMTKAAAPTDRDTTFPYPDELIWPVATVVGRIFRMRNEDDISNIADFAAETFGAVIRRWSQRLGDGPNPIRDY